MDCDSCGRYRPSSEIGPIHDPADPAEGRLVMACARCRRLIAGRGLDRIPFAEAVNDVATALRFRRRAFYAN